MNNSETYSLENLEEMSRGNSDFVKRMAFMFVTESSKSIDKIRAAFEQRDYNTIHSAIHRLKPSTEVLQMEEVIKSLTQVQALCKNESDAGMDHLLRNIEQSYIAVFDDILLKFK